MSMFITWIVYPKRFSLFLKLKFHQSMVAKLVELSDLFLTNYGNHSFHDQERVSKDITQEGYKSTIGFAQFHDCLINRVLKSNPMRGRPKKVSSCIIKNKSNNWFFRNALVNGVALHEYIRLYATSKND